MSKRTAKVFPLMPAICEDCNGLFTARAYPNPDTGQREYSRICPPCADTRHCADTFAFAKAFVALRNSECQMQNCHSAIAHNHHMDAVTHAGTNDHVNIVGLCVNCHRYVHSTMWNAARLDSDRLWAMVNTWYSEWRADNIARARATECLIRLAYYRTVVGRAAMGTVRTAA